MWAFKALLLIVMITYGFELLPVRWQIVVLPLPPLSPATAEVEGDQARANMQSAKLQAKVRAIFFMGLLP